MMTTTKRRVTVTLDAEEIEAIKAISAHIGTPSASAAIRRALREHADAIRKGRDRASRLPQAAA